MNKFMNFILLSLFLCAQAHGMDFNTEINTQLLVAAEEGNLENVNHLIAAKADVNNANGYGTTPLMHAAAEGHLLCLQTLIAANASVNQIDKLSRTALILAAENDRLSCLQTLIAAKANFNDNGFCLTSFVTPLTAAARNGHQLVCETLVEVLLCKPSYEQKQSLITLFGIDKYRKRLCPYGLDRNTRISLYKAWLFNMYEQNKRDFVGSLAYRHISAIPGYYCRETSHIKEYLLEKYSNKSNATNENKPN